MSDFRYAFPLDENNCVPADAQFRILADELVYGQSVGEESARFGKRWAVRGDVLPFYKEALRYPDRVQILIDMKAIEYVKPLVIERPAKSKPVKVEETKEENKE